jgi:chromosome partitioning protein
MDAPSYSAKAAAEVLGLPLRTLQSALKQEKYSGVDLWAVRHTLHHFPRPLGHRKQLFLNFKGGTGKTALSTSYAWRLAELGYHVLLVDLDSQGHATKCLGFEGEDFEKTLLNVLVRKAPMDEVIQHSPMPNLDFVPSNLTMSTVDLALMPMSAREFKLKNALKDVHQRYDAVVFDAPPSFGLLNLNALMAADDLFVPVLPDFLSFHGLKLLFETVQSLEDDLAHVLDHVFIIVNSFNQTFKLAKEALEALKTHYPEYMLTAMVRQCTKFAQASSEGVPVFLADRDSKGATDINSMVTEVLARIEAAQSRTPAPGRDAQKAG